jgi:hypothetical protein
VFTPVGLLWLGGFARAVAQAEIEFRATVVQDVATAVSLGLQVHGGAG